MRHALFFIAALAVLTLMIPFCAVLMFTKSAVSDSALPQESSAAPSVSHAVQSQELQTKLPVISSQDMPQSVEQTASFNILDRSNGSVFTVDCEEYIRGAVASEMPASFHSQALAAQAVAAHTWALYSSNRQKEQADETLCGADFSVDTAKAEGYITKERFFERYGSNAQLFWPKICDAAKYASDKIVAFEGEPALTAYHSTSVGETEASENVWTVSLPYLVPVESEGDLLAPNYSVTETFDQKTMRLLLEQAFPEASLPNDSPQKWLVPLETSASGYVTLVRVGGDEVHGQKLRNALGLRSSCFDISFSKGTFSITVKGYGHGVGMSQYGADFMARQGKSCEEILSHYYPNTQIITVSQ